VTGSIESLYRLSFRPRKTEANFADRARLPSEGYAAERAQKTGFSAAAAVLATGTDLAACQQVLEIPGQRIVLVLKGLVVVGDEASAGS